MNKTLLQLFLDHPDQYISGEEISRQLQISRAAVWKQINKLRENGYEFDAISRVGYRLKQKPSRLDHVSLISQLRSTTMGKNIRVVDATPSTQLIAQQWAEEGAPEGAVVIAEQQTSGRGRMGRNWHSPAGKGIWMSIVLRPQISLQFTPQLTLLMAVALSRSLQRFIDKPIGIKWPNDLLLDGKKLCGILLESSAEDERVRYVIAGIGINANLTLDDYPDELRDIVTSLKMASGNDVDRAGIIVDFLAELESLYQLYHEQGFSFIRSLWEANSISLHRPITLHTPRGPIRGIAEKLDDSGALWMKDDHGQEHQIFSGDLEIHR